MFIGIKFPIVGLNNFADILEFEYSASWSGFTDGS
jgi:hypothetical protein